MECSMPVTNTDAPQRSRKRVSERSRSLRASPCAIRPDAVPGVEPRVERPQPGRLRARQEVEPEEGERDVERAPTARGLRMHQAVPSGSRDVGRSRQLAASAAVYSSHGSPSRRVNRPSACQITSVGTHAARARRYVGGGEDRGHLMT
jgi:hypothetical protein